MDEFKFQSILADDFLDFFLDYFPELKKKRVDSIPGEQRSRPTASRRSWRVGSAFRPEGPVCSLGGGALGWPRGPTEGPLPPPASFAPLGLSAPVCPLVSLSLRHSQTLSPAQATAAPRGSPGRTGAAALTGELVGGL